jgi:hypothetical protein
MRNATPLPAQRPALECERLETRDVPAGNVTAILSGGTLVLAGDTAENQFGVQQNALGDIVVFGLGETTVNGQASVFVGRGVLVALAADLGDGRDHFEVSGLFVSSDIVIHGGNGGDLIALGNVGAGRNIEVYSGEQGDTVSVSGAIAGNVLWLDGGNDFDLLHADNSGGVNGTFAWNFEQGF